MKTSVRNKSYISKGMLTNWKFIEDALPGKCGVMDIDGIIERRGKFLVIESKSPAETIDKGQMITLEALSRLPSFTVIVAWMDIVNGTVFGVNVIKNGKVEDFINTDTPTFLYWVKSWFDKASEK